MDEMEQTMMMVCGQAHEALKSVAKMADYKNPKDAEAIEKLVKILHYGKCMTGEGGSSYGGGSYRRGRDSMGRYTSYRSSGGPDMGYAMPYERGYSEAEQQKIEELCRELEFMQTRVAGPERTYLQEAISALKTK